MNTTRAARVTVSALCQAMYLWFCTVLKVTSNMAFVLCQAVTEFSKVIYSLVDWRLVFL